MPMIESPEAEASRLRARLSELEGAQQQSAPQRRRKGLSRAAKTVCLITGLTVLAASAALAIYNNTGNHFDASGVADMASAPSPQEQSSPAPQDAEAKETEALETAAQAGIKAYTAHSQGNAITSVSVDKIDERSISLKMQYEVGVPDSDTGPRTESESLVHEVLQALLAAGRHPADEHFTVSATPEFDGEGETGVPKTHFYGTARYNWSQDSIEWDP